MAIWFEHRQNLRNDIDVCMMRYCYGSLGYGLYLALIEMLAAAVDNKLPIGTAIEGMPENFVGDCIEFGLFNTDKIMFWAKRIRFRGAIKSSTVRMYNTNVKQWYRLREEVFERDNYACFYCGKRGGKIEADHVVPFSRGGLDDLDNLVTACRKCNRQKKDKTSEEFYRWRCANAETN